uniref:Uncharacterized protein n=1 Tax=Peronospora matthiolae TaxID=2874970 RepID=A0AAV1TCT6_9STRA
MSKNADDSESSTAASGCSLSKAFENEYGSNRQTDMELDP